MAYTGLPYDQEAAGLTYAHARWYDASQGRFVSRDPLGGSLAAPSSQNRYAYAQDNPTTLMDPSGLGTISGAGGGVGGGGRATSACGGCALALANPVSATSQATTTASSSAASGPHTLSGYVISAGQALFNFPFANVFNPLIGLGLLVGGIIPVVGPFSVIAGAVLLAINVAGGLLIAIGQTFQGSGGGLLANGLALFLLGLLFIAAASAFAFALVYVLAGASPLAWAIFVTNPAATVWLALTVFALVVGIVLWTSIAQCLGDPQCRSSSTS